MSGPSCLVCGEEEEALHEEESGLVCLDCCAEPLICSDCGLHSTCNDAHGQCQFDASEDD